MREPYQVIGVGVGIALDPQDDALMDSAAAQPVELRATRLHHRDAKVGREHDGLADALVLIQPRAYVQRGRRDPGVQGLQDRVTAGHELGDSAAGPAGPDLAGTAATGAPPAADIARPAAGRASRPARAS